MLDGRVFFLEKIFVEGEFLLRVECVCFLRLFRVICYIYLPGNLDLVVGRSWVGFRNLFLHGVNMTN